MISCMLLAAMAIYYSIDGMSESSAASLVAGRIAAGLTLVSVLLLVTFRLWK